MIAIFTGAPGLDEEASMTLGLGFLVARPAPINMRFDSSSSKGRGWSVNVSTLGRTGPTTVMIAPAMTKPSTTLRHLSIYFLLEKTTVPWRWVGLDLGTSGSVLRTHRGPICARHCIDMRSRSLRHMIHGKEVPRPPPQRSRRTTKSPYLRWIHRAKHLV